MAISGQEPGVRDGLEVDHQSLDLVTFYARNLGVPERRNLNDPAVLQGKEVFYSLGCQSSEMAENIEVFQQHGAEWREVDADIIAHRDALSQVPPAGAAELQRAAGREVAAWEAVWQGEWERALDLIRQVRDQGITVVLISHNMRQVLKVADRVEVLRLGRRVAQFDAASATVESLVAAMTAGGATVEEDAA